MACRASPSIAAEYPEANHERPVDEDAAIGWRLVGPRPRAKAPPPRPTSRRSCEPPMPLCHELGKAQAKDAADGGRAGGSGGGPAVGSSRAFAQHYELERARCARREAENQELCLPRAQWGPTQVGPPYSARAPRILTAFRTHNYAGREPMRETFGEFILSDLRLPYVPMPACEEVRSTARCAPPELGLPTPRRLDHSGGAWLPSPAPTAAVEPFVEVAKYMFHCRDLPRPSPRPRRAEAASGGRQLPAATRARLLGPEMIEQLRSKFKAAAYTGHRGRQLDVLFRRCDKDGTGSLEEAEVRDLVRRVLRIPPAVLSDADIASVCCVLDADCSGTVTIRELVEFVGPEPARKAPAAGKGLANVASLRSVGVSST